MTSVAMVPSALSVPTDFISSENFLWCGPVSWQPASSLFSFHGNDRFDNCLLPGSRSTLLGRFPGNWSSCVTPDNRKSPRDDRYRMCLAVYLHVVVDTDFPAIPNDLKRRFVGMYHPGFKQVFALFVIKDGHMYINSLDDPVGHGVVFKFYTVFLIYCKLHGIRLSGPRLG